MTNPLHKHLFVRCDSCPEEYNCHDESEVRWSRVMDGSSAKPKPVCKECWDGIDDPPCKWEDLEKIEIHLK